MRSIRIGDNEKSTSPSFKTNLSPRSTRGNEKRSLGSARRCVIGIHGTLRRLSYRDRDGTIGLKWKMRADRARRSRASGVRERARAYESTREVKGRERERCAYI